MNIANIKKWLASIFTALVVIIFFGIVFVTFDIVEPSPRYYTEVLIIASVTTIIRFTWYSDGELKASSEQIIIDAKANYSQLIADTIEDQADLEKFLVELNEENKRLWVKNKLGNKTPENCPKYHKLKDRYDRWVGFFVKPITSGQILTRSGKYKIIDAKDYGKSFKYSYQALSVVISMVSSIVLACLAFNELRLNWENIFRYITYLGNIVWAMFSSLSSGYKNYNAVTSDHISRLTMIVNRYSDWKGGRCGNEG